MREMVKEKLGECPVGEDQKLQEYYAERERDGVKGGDYEEKKKDVVCGGQNNG